MSEWIALTAMEETQLPVLLEECGLDRDDRALANIWSAWQNRPLLVDKPRPAFLLYMDDTIRVPPPPIAADAVLRTYLCTGDEKSVDEVVEIIKGLHGKGSAEQLTVPVEEFDAEDLFALVHNRDFKVRRDYEETFAIKSGEVVHYLTRARQTRTHDVSPSTDLADGTSTLPTGPGPYSVTVELAESGQVLEAFDVTTDMKARTPGDRIEGRWRAKPVKLKIQIAKTGADGADPEIIRTTVCIRSPDRMYFSEAFIEGDLVKVGEPIIWEWDGFTKPRPAPGEPDQGELDTEVLRGQLIVEVTVIPAVGVPGRGVLQLANKAVHPFVDVYINLARSEVRGSAWVSFNHLLEDEGMWLLAMIAAGAATVGVVAIEALVMGIQAAVRHGEGKEPMPDRIRDQYLWAMLGSAAALLVAAPIVTASLFGAAKLSDEEFDRIASNIKNGIGKHWSRKLTISDGATLPVERELSFVAQARTEDGHDAVRYALYNMIDSVGRACNMSMVAGFLPILFPYDPKDNDAEREHTGAHEFGHSILEGAVDTDWSIHHKSSSGGITDQSPTRTAEGGFAPPDDEFDLMIYYDRKKPGSEEYAPRTVPRSLELQYSFAAPVDVAGWISLAQIEFREA